MANKGNDETFENDLQQLQQMLHEASAYMTAQVISEKTAIFIGNAKAGKSSLINYVIGNKLIGEKTSACRPVILKKANDSPGPKIGNEAVAETAIPTRWNSSKLPYLGIWDLPGFDDIRGIIQDIINAFYTSQLLNNLTSAKFVIVTDVNDIASDSIRPFLSLLNSVEDLLRKAMRECFSSIVVIFTKVPDKLFDNKVDKQFIKELLEEKFLACSGIEISKTAKDFIQFLIENDQNIGFFYKAQEGPVDDSAIELDVISAIKNSKNVPEHILKQVLPSLAEKSKNYLHKKDAAVICPMEIFGKLVKALSYVCEKKNSYYREVIEKDDVKREKLESVKKDLFDSINHMRTVTFCNLSLQKKIKALQSIDPSIEELTKHNLIERVKLMEFIDRVLNMARSNDFNVAIHEILSSALAEQEIFSRRICVKLREMAEREERNKMLTQLAVSALATGAMLFRFFPSR